MKLQQYRIFSTNLRRSLEKETDVLGLVALGSMAEVRRLPDEWSDHDFFVITRSGKQEGFRQDLSWLPDHKNIVAAIRENAHGLKVIYASGHLLEFAVFDEEELHIARVNDYKVLLDRTGITQTMSKLVQKNEEPASFDLVKAMQMFLALLLVGAGRAARGERISASMFIKVYALDHFLQGMIRVLPSDDLDNLDNLDVFRRVEMVFPEYADQLNRILLLEPIACGLALLQFSGQKLQPFIADYPSRLAHIVTQYLNRVLNITQKNEDSNIEEY